MRRVFCLLIAVLLMWTASASAAVLPSGLKEIEKEAFYGVPITDVTIPDGVTAIGARAFSTATLLHATIPASVKDIDGTAFEGTAKSFFATVTKGSYAEEWCGKNKIAYSYTDTLYVTPSVKAASVAKEGEKYLGTPYYLMDCQAFVEACLKDAGMPVDLAGSNAWYRTMTWTGTPEECIALFGYIPKGAFLYILESDGKEPQKYKADKIGNASHIGIYTGTYYGAMASSKSRGCVIHSYFQGASINGSWNRVGLWKQLYYDETINRWLQSR